MKYLIDAGRALLVVSLATLLVQDMANAQSSRDRRREDDAPTARQLELRMEKAEENLVAEYKDVAIEFYKQDQKEKALELLNRLRKLAPEMPGLEEQIDAINEEIMQSNPIEVDIDTSKSWGNAVAVVEEGKPFRIAAAGDYKIKYDTSISVDGLPSEDETKHYLNSVPFGALIGVVVSDGKIGKPFAVKGELEHAPEKSGQLFLRVNVPAEVRCTGKLKVQLSGSVTAVGRKR
jgi:hypothetical protein